MPKLTVDLIDASDLTFATDELCVFYRNRRIDLTETPLKVLRCIHGRHPAHVSNEYLCEHVWGTNYMERNVPQQHVSALNRVLQSFGLFVHGENNRGYRLAIFGNEAQEQKQLKASRGALRSKTSIEVFKDWRDANWIISKATKSLLIIDSYFDHSGEFEPLIIDALRVKATRLRVSIYLADPRHNFGAQRFKEKEKPKDSELTYKQVLERNDKRLLNHYRGKYQRKFDGCVGEIIGHFVKPRVRLRIYAYPTMPATRVYVVDDKHYIFGCFPLLAHNPAYPCFHGTRDGNLTEAAAVAVNQLAQQVKIIRRISDQVWPPKDTAR